MPKYTAYLSSRSFLRLAKEIKDYRKKLEKNLQIFCDELAKEGFNVIHAILEEHPHGSGDSLGSLKIISDGGNGIYKARIQVTSEAILFLEFGSGLHYAAPHGGEQTPAMLPGSFSVAERQNPEFPNWANPSGWVYFGRDGNFYHSHGMAPSMPMYRGGKAIEEKLEPIAKKVFG